MKVKQKIKTREQRGLSKYDAPLFIQYKKGLSAFYRNEPSPYKTNTMQHREWVRGWTVAYFENLKRVKNNELRRGSEKVYAK
jgi:hypothetical protein|tara:strand:- start:137 stop:382 length:246 start_codon:yes stop_codon:yes gene_type:complete